LTTTAKNSSVALSAIAGDAKPTPMTDEQMDQITAGVGPGHGVGTAITLGAPVNNAARDHLEINAEKFHFTTGVQPGSGVCTAGRKLTVETHC
jgi:hypothetical protein